MFVRWHVLNPQGTVCLAWMFLSPCAVGVVVILILNCHSRLNLYSEKVTVLLSLLSRSFRWKAGSENMGKGREHCCALLCFGFPKMCGLKGLVSVFPYLGRKNL